MPRLLPFLLCLVALLAAADRDRTLDEIRSMGVTRVRALVYWRTFTDKPRSSRAPRFDLRDPDAYPDETWGLLDRLVAAAAPPRVEPPLPPPRPGPGGGAKTRK